MFQKFFAARFFAAMGISCWLCASLTFAQTENDTAQTETKKTPPAVDTPASKVNPVAVKNGLARLTPANTKVEFVGTHVGDEPKPRLGGFADFAGELQLSDDGKTVSTVSIEFKMTSVWTEFPKLTQHLQQADFFEVEKYPTSKFVSTRIVAGEKPGTVNLTGDFSLHGTTKEITLPAMVQVDENGVVLKSEFKLDRTIFGMDKMTDGVESLVAVNVSIGESTKSGGSQTAQQPRPAGGGINATTFFKGMDKDGDGKLTGDEIPERMQQGLSRIDTNGDGEVTLEEIQARFQQRGNRGGGDR